MCGHTGTAANTSDSLPRLADLCHSDKPPNYCCFVNQSISSRLRPNCMFVYKSRTGYSYFKPQKKSLEFFKVELHLIVSVGHSMQFILCDSTDYIFKKQVVASCKQTTLHLNKWDSFAFCTYFTDKSQGTCQYLAVNNRPNPIESI